MNNSRAFLHITYKLYGHLDKLSGTKKSNCLNCYLSLMKHAWKKNNYECGLRYSTVAKETKLSRITVRRTLDTLEKLNVPNEMGLIIRTAGAKTTSTEIKRDYKYLTKTWDKIKEDTLSSNAPALIYEDGGVIQRTLRDLYTKDVDNIYVEGSELYKITKNFMKLLMPSHAVKVKQWKESSPIFQKNNIENQLSSIYADEVYLPSGGSLVLNQTEALVAIDVNSGSSTKYYNIEETAIKTNLEAATEIARQLRLRDMAGLVVIDFIDMEKFQNRRSVEKKLKESLKSDRSKIQVGKISSFGLLEMSRQRIRADPTIPDIPKFAEHIYFKPAKTVSISKDEPRWRTGIWLGFIDHTNEHLIGTTKGVIKCRAIRLSLIHI